MKIVVLFLFFSILPVLHVDAQEQNAASADSVSGSGATDDKADSLLYSRPVFKYESLGRKDPFESLVPEAIDEEEKVIKDLFNYEKAVILGIVNSEKDSYVLVEDENGASYVLRSGDRIFGGFVTQVTENAVYFHIVKYGRAMTIIMRLESSKRTVFEERDGASVIKKPGINISYEKGALDKKEVLIEEVTVPSLEIMTIEEEWFGPKGEFPETLNSESDAGQIERKGSFLLTEPPDNSWIKLPYMVDWTNAEEKNVSYSLMIDDDSDFNSPIFSKDGIMISSYLMNDEMELPPNKELFWTVIAVDSSGELSVSMQSFMSFKIIGQKR